MGLLKRRKPEMADTDIALEMSDNPKGSTEDKDTPQRVTERPVVIRDVTEEFDQKMAEMTEKFASKEDVSEEIMHLHQKVDNIVAYLKRKEQGPTL